MEKQPTLFNTDNGGYQTGSSYAKGTSYTKNNSYAKGNSYTNTNDINFRDLADLAGLAKGKTKGTYQCPHCGGKIWSGHRAWGTGTSCNHTKTEIRHELLKRAGLWVEYGSDRDTTSRSTTPGRYISEELREELAASAIPDGPWQGLNFSSIDSPKAIAEFLGWRAYKGPAGWVSTMGNGDRSQNQFKPEGPISFLKNKDEALITVALLLGGSGLWRLSLKLEKSKYLTSKAGYGVLIPKVPGDGGRTFWPAFLADKSQILRVTEGAKKTISSQVNTGIHTVGVVGVSMWHSKGSRELLPELKELVSDRPVEIAFDADFARKSAVRRQIVDLGEAIEKVGGRVSVRVWDEKYGKGIDDVIAAGHDIDAISQVLTLTEFKTQFPNPDEAPFYEPDPDEYLEYQRHLEFLEFCDEQDCKRKRELWIDQKKQSSYRRWKRSLQFSPEYLDTKSQYVDKNIFSADAGNVALLGPMGIGKTEALRERVAHLIRQGATGLLIGSRNSCLLQTCQRLGFPHLLYGGNASSLLEIQPGNFWGHCVDSLPRWTEASELPKVVILDEISSLLAHVSLGATCRKNRLHILKLLGEILREAEYVYLLDANLKNWEVDFIEYLAGTKFTRVEKPRDTNQIPLKIYNFIGSYCPETPLEYPEILAHNSQKELNKYKPNNSHFWRESFLLEQAPTAVFSDSLKELKRLICLKFGEDKLDFYTGLRNGILRIDAETRNYPEVHAFQSDPVRFLLEHNIIALFCSPSVESGISIKFNRSNLEELGKLLDDTRDYFGGFWLYNCHLSNEPITQMLMRVRNRNVPRYLFSRTYSPVPILDSNSEIERNYLAALNTALTNYLDASQFDNEFLAGTGIELDLENIHNQVGEIIKRSFDGDLMSWHLLTQKIKAQQSYEKQNLRATLLERLAEDGADIVDVVGGTERRSLKEVNIKIAMHRAGEIFDAADTFVNVDGYEVEMTHAIAEEWSKGYLVSPEKRLIGEKWLIKNSLLPGIDATGLWSLDFLANFKFLNPDTYKQLYYRAISSDLTTFEKLKALKVSELLSVGEGILTTDISKALPYVKSAIKTGLSSLWTGAKKIYKGEEKKLKEIAKKCTHKTNSWLFGKMGKQSLIKYLNSILSNFGYALKSTRRREKGKRIREYQIEDLIETEIATKCEPLIINKYQRILEEKIARNLDFANNNPQTTDIATLEAVPRRIDESRLLDSRGTGTNAPIATVTDAKNENQEKTAPKAKSTPHNPETKIPTPREELLSWQIEILEDYGYIL